MKTFTFLRDRMPTDSVCLYSDQENFKVEYPELKAVRKTPVCIIGAGFVGVMTAHYLAQMGVESIIIERHRVGWGASGRNSGQIIPGFNADPRSLAKTYGETLIKEIYRLNLEAKNDILENIKNVAPQCHYKAGLVVPALSTRGYADQQDYAAYMADTFGYKLTLLNADQTAERLGTKVYPAAFEDMNGGHFNPQKYLNLMAQNCVKSGLVAIFENTPAISVAASGNTVTIETPYGHEITSDILIGGDCLNTNDIFQQNNQHTFNAKALEQTQLLLIPLSWAKINLEKFGQISAHLRQGLVNRLNNAQIEAEHKSTMTAPQITACYLRRLCVLYCFDPAGFELPYHKNLIASRLHIEPETFSRTIKTLKHAGLTVDGTHVRFTDIAKNAKFVCDNCSVSEGCTANKPLVLFKKP